MSVRRKARPERCGFYLRTTRNTGLPLEPRWPSRAVLWLLTAVVLCLVFAVTYWYVLAVTIVLAFVRTWLRHRLV